MIKIILDTNFLIYCAKNKLDYPEEIDRIINEGYEIIVPEQVIDELNIVANKKKQKVPLFKRSARFKKTTGKDKDAAILAIQLLKHYDIKSEKTNGKNVDEAIINLAKLNENNIVATLDKEMRNILGRVILINKDKKLMLTK